MKLSLINCVFNILAVISQIILDVTIYLNGDFK